MKIDIWEVYSYIEPLNIDEEFTDTFITAVISKDGKYPVEKILQSIYFPTRKLDELSIKKKDNYVEMKYCPLEDTCVAVDAFLEKKDATIDELRKIIHEAIEGGEAVQVVVCRDDNIIVGQVISLY